jgi:hypothetical protein
MGGVLRNDVHITLSDKPGDVVVLHRGETVPKEYAKYVTNPKAYADEVQPAEESGGSEGAESKGYGDLKGDALRDLLKQRELPQTGTNAEMIERLTADDAERDTGSEESGGSEGAESKED